MSKTNRKPATVTPASRLLDVARADAPGMTFGHARSDAARVAYDRTLCRYEVGTDAVLVIIGARSAVLPYLDALLSGCVTRTECDQWIADAPKRTAATVA